MTSGPAPVTARIAAIQQRIAAFAPPPTFQAKLAVAMEEGAGSPSSPPRPVGTTVVGILGTPVEVAPGVAFDLTPPAAAGYSLPPVPARLAEWTDGLPERGLRYSGLIEQAAAAAGIDPRLLAAVAWAESGFKADAISHAGAIGLVQLMPGTAAGLGVDPWDPAQNLQGGARYLATQLGRFGRVDHALAAYNAGPGRVQRAGGIPNIAETKAYVPKVLEYYARLGGTP